MGFGYNERLGYGTDQSRFLHEEIRRNRSAESQPYSSNAQDIGPTCATAAPSPTKRRTSHSLARARHVPHDIGAYQDSQGARIRADSRDHHLATRRGLGLNNDAILLICSLATTTVIVILLIHGELPDFKTVLWEAMTGRNPSDMYIV